MIISAKYKLLFVHIPKSGGTSFRQLIARNDRQAIQHEVFHAPLTKECFDQYRDFHKVVVVRNSWELCASCYKFERENRPGTNFMPDLNMSFYEWLHWKCEFRKPCHYPFPRQLKYFTDSSANILVDQIIQYDNFQLDVEALCARLGIPFSLKKTHYYGEYDYRQFYQDDLDIELVADICADDIAHFGWSFPAA